MTIRNLRGMLAVPTVASALLLGLAACGTVNTTTTRGEPSADAVEVRQDINDALSNLAIHATEVRMFESPSGALQAQVDIANDGFRTRRFAYRFDWVDGRGNVIPSQNAVWRNASIPAGGSAVISSTALTPEATDFKLQVRRSN
jgi:uncharacterized protein YcfL